MPDKEEHLKIVNKNFMALSHLTAPDASKYTDWCTTIIFYMTLHYIQAYLAEKSNKHPTSHLALQSLIENNPNLKSIYSKYRSLEDDSRDARYNGIRLSVYQMRNEILKSFADIQVTVIQKLGLPEEIKLDLYPLFPST